jgi:hypothetical protein
LYRAIQKNHDPFFNGPLHRGVCTTAGHDRPIAIVCPPDQTPEFIASLQRAFAARRLYSGDISGSWTPATVRSMRDFQSARAITTQSPSVAMAQELGLLPIDRP